MTDKITENINDESMVYENEIESQIDVCETENLEQNEFKTNACNDNFESVSSDPSLFQITEAEPFLGFSDVIVTESICNDRKYLLECIQEPESDLQDARLDVSKIYIETAQNVQNIDDITHSKIEDPLNISVEKKLNEKERKSKKDINLDNLSDQDFDLMEEENDKSNRDISQNNCSGEIEDDSISKSKSFETQEDSIMSNESYVCDSSSSSDSDKESMYDTCESEQSISEKEDKGFIPLPSPRVILERLNDSTFIRYHVKGKKEPKVSIKRLKDSVFFKYYEKILPANRSSSNSNVTDRNRSDIDAGLTEAVDTTSECNDSQNENEESLSDAYEVKKSDDNDVSLLNCSRNDDSSTSNHTESDSVEAQPNEIVITDSSTTEDIESVDETSNNEDETHVSFVTTRRRNEVTNDSMFIFDNSYGSTSTEGDKTVLSNKARLSYFEKSDLEVDISVINARASDSSYFEACEDMSAHKNRADRIQRNTRKTSRPTRLSEVNRDINYSMNEVTLIADEGLDNGKMLTNVSSNQTEEHTSRSSVTTRKSSRVPRESVSDRTSSINTEVKPSIVLQPGKKWERSLSIYRRMTTMADYLNQSLLEDEGQNKGRKYRQSVISTMEMQGKILIHRIIRSFLVHLVSYW